MNSDPITATILPTAPQPVARPGGASTPEERLLDDILAAGVAPGDRAGALRVLRGRHAR